MKQLYSIRSAVVHGVNVRLRNRAQVSTPPPAGVGPRNWDPQQITNAKLYKYNVKQEWSETIRHVIPK